MCKKDNWYKGCIDHKICETINKCQEALIIARERKYRERGLPDNLSNQAAQSTCMHPEAITERQIASE